LAGAGPACGRVGCVFSRFLYNILIARPVSEEMIMAKDKDKKKDKNKKKEKKQDKKKEKK
jgi:hypothetical protein